MMLDIRLSALGRLGKNPEFKTTSNGHECLTFSVATGIAKDKTIWINCTLWGRRARALKDPLRKGMLVTFTGDLTDLENRNVNIAKIKIIPGQKNRPDDEPSSPQPEPSKEELNQMF